MKKVFVLVLVLILLSVPLYTALATGVDLSGMTNDELTAMKQQVDAEMLERGIAKTAILLPGEYIIGSDIPAGTYALSINSEDPGYGRYWLYADQEAFIKRVVDEAVLTVSGEMINSDGPVKVTLIDGQLLQIEYTTSVRITGYAIQWE